MDLGSGTQGGSQPVGGVCPWEAPLCQAGLQLHPPWPTLSSSPLRAVGPHTQASSLPQPPLQPQSPEGAQVTPRHMVAS